MMNFAEHGILDSSISDRIQLVEGIWDSIAEVPDSLGLTEEQKGELDRRLDSYHKDPTSGSPFSEESRINWSVGL
jgi:putative addiction module component (TIGR02574 family)